MYTTLYLAPYGDDSWNGLQAKPNETRTDGPLKTFDEARKRATRLRNQNMTTGTVTIVVAGGHYEFKNALGFELRDRGIKFVAAPGEEPIIDGSEAIAGWTETEVHGKRCWTAEIGPTLADREVPRSLFANGERRPRSRYPKEGWLAIEEVPDAPLEGCGLFGGQASRFIVKDGDFQADWRNRDQIEAVVNHLWIEERMPVLDYDAETRLLTSTHRSIFSLRNASWMGDTPCAKFIFENVFEAMSEPGEWYLDPQEERLYYLPKEGETLENTEVRLALQTQLVRVHGDVANNLKLQDIHFEGITFTRTDWLHNQGWGKWWDAKTPEASWPERDSFRHFTCNNLNSVALKPDVKFAAVPQAAVDLPGAISLEAAQDCSFLNCRFQGLGLYAIDVRGGCSHLRIQGNHIEDIGGGGVKIDGADEQGNQNFRTHHIYVGDNTIRHCGQIYPSSIGIIIVHADRNVLEHNEISHQFYSAISCGWVWGYEENPTHHNTIQYNYIHDIGLGRLSDMGGIYLLGEQAGTHLRGNHIHDIRGNHYGGWGIYLDEGSSEIMVEGNLVYRTNSQCLHEHWGRANIYRDNIFALASQACAVFAHEEHDLWYNYPSKGILFMRNVVLTDGSAPFIDAQRYLEANRLDSDFNLFWDVSKGKELPLWKLDPWPGIGGETGEFTFEQMQEKFGLERNSRQEDPGFADPKNGNFALSADSPVHQLGIKVLDPSKCGPRSVEGRSPKPESSYRAGGAETIFAD